MKRFVRGLFRFSTRMLMYGTIGGLAVLVVVSVVYLQNRPDLNVWHEANLDAEYTKSSKIQSFDGYLSLEERLFAQLDEVVYEKAELSSRHPISRYHRNTLSDPSRLPTNWNRTFILGSPSPPRAGVLLLHGMSDSPYSLRSIGQRLNAEGAWVIGLRLPGHGTAPSGLVRTTWQDMAAAVKLAMRELRQKVGGQPIFIVGYSNGGALAVHYALASMEDRELPRVHGLVLISPEIGVTPFAALASLQAALGRLIGSTKLAWNSILPEYDPFKYNSFAVNAGDQAYRLTKEVQSCLTAYLRMADPPAFPPVLAFQSVVDATVLVQAVIDGLFQRLPTGRHELVLFDINRSTKIENILKTDPVLVLGDLLGTAPLSFTVSFITNQSREGRKVVVRRKTAGSSSLQETDLFMEWPPNLYSLSHVALPICSEDPLYGINADNSPGLHLGTLAFRGERGALRIAASDMLRLRSNPFYSYLEMRTIDFMGFGSLGDGEHLEAVIKTKGHP